MDVGQNGRPLRGPQMWKSSLVLAIHNFGVPNDLTHTHIMEYDDLPQFATPFLDKLMKQTLLCEVQPNRISGDHKSSPKSTRNEWYK